MGQVPDTSRGLSGISDSAISDAGMAHLGMLRDFGGATGLWSGRHIGKRLLREGSRGSDGRRGDERVLHHVQGREKGIEGEMSSGGPVHEHRGPRRKLVVLHPEQVDEFAARAGNSSSCTQSRTATGIRGKRWNE